MNAAQQAEIIINAGDVQLPAFLSIPPSAQGIVLFAHGSGSSRFSTRNRQVADDLNAHGFATLLLDLLDAREHERDAVTRSFRFDIPRLAVRMRHAIDQVRSDAATCGLPVGLFGASTGAAAALIAAAERPGKVQAVVSRGGRPDLADDALPVVRTNVLLIVGSRDEQVIELNQQAAARLETVHHIAIIEGATHLFEEPGALEEVQRLARDWFARWLSREALA